MPCTVRAGTFLSDDAAAAEQVGRARQHLQRGDAAGQLARELRILRPDRVLGPDLGGVRLRRLVAVLGRGDAGRRIDAEVGVDVDDARRDELAAGVDHGRARRHVDAWRRPRRSCRRAPGPCRSGSPARPRSSPSRCGSRTAARPGPCRCSGTDRRSASTARPCPAAAPSPWRRQRRARAGVLAGVAGGWASAAGRGLRPGGGRLDQRQREEAAGQRAKKCAHG